MKMPMVRGGVGILVLFYGGHFKTTAVVCGALDTDTVEQIEADYAQTTREYRRAKRQFQQCSGEDARLNVAGLTAAAAVLDTRPLFSSLNRLQRSLVAQVAMALNQNTQSLGIGLQIGQYTSRMVAGPIERVVFGEGDQATDEGQRRQFLMGVDVACTFVGLGAAWCLRGWAALWTSCNLGARLCCEAFGSEHGEQGAVYVTVLTGVGFAFHVRYWGYPPLPWPLNLAVLPVRIVESGLKSIA